MNMVKRVCEELGINQSELAQKLNTSRSAVSKWSNGEIPTGAKVSLELLLENYQLKKQLSIVNAFRDLLTEGNIKF